MHTESIPCGIFQIRGATPLSHNSNWNDTRKRGIDCHFKQETRLYERAVEAAVNIARDACVFGSHNCLQIRCFPRVGFRKV